MRNLYKISIIAIISIIAGIAPTFAYDNDCGIFAIKNFANTGEAKNGYDTIKTSRNTTENIYSNFLTTSQQEAIIDTNSLNTAILNLTKYCCEKKLGGLDENSKSCTGDNATFFNDNALDSPYLFDHIFDVIMRRLNGLTGENDIYIKSDMTVDYTGAEWRSRITEKAENLSGSNPQEIIDKYQTFRKQTPKYDIANKINETFGDLSTDAFLKYVRGQGGSDESEEVAKALQEYEKWSMYDRYNNACTLTQYFYALLNVGSSNDDKVRTIRRLTNGSCNQIVKNQINAENAYTKLVIQKSANLFLKNYIEGYKDYQNERKENLKDTRKEATDRFLDVVKAVPQLVKSCVH